MRIDLCLNACKTYGNFIGLAGSEDYFNNTTANSIYSVDGSTSINIGSDSYAANRVPRYNNNTNIGGKNSLGEDLVAKYYDGDNVSQWYGYGNYYTWAAAIASTGQYMGAEVTDTSICPSGWKLPRGNESIGTLTGTPEDDANDPANRVGSFSYLNRVLGGSSTSEDGDNVSIKWRLFPYNFVYAGPYDFGDMVGTSGFYWSSSSMNRASAYDLYFYGPFIGLDGTDNKTSGQSIRCVTGL